jgi:AraC-like DNA-binding protein
MEELAREVALSRPHFFDLFRRSLGITPQTFRNVVRMESAYRALHTGAPIGELAKALGFSAHSHFTRFFRENHGISPDAYRRAAWQLENNAWR